MKKDDKKPANEWAFLGRGILRTFVRDLKSILIGVGIGALVGLLGSLVLGYSYLFGLKFGVLVGAFVALMGRSHMSRLFDYDQSTSDRDSNSQ